MIKDTIIEREVEEFEDKCFQMTDKGGFIIRYESGFVGIATGTQTDWLRKALTRLYEAAEEAGRKERDGEIYALIEEVIAKLDSRHLDLTTQTLRTFACTVLRTVQEWLTPPTPEEHTSDSKHSTDKCHLTYSDELEGGGYLMCAYNHAIGEECLMDDKSNLPPKQ